MIGKYKIDMAIGKDGMTAYRIYDTERDEMLPYEYTFMTEAILAAIVLDS